MTRVTASYYDCFLALAVFLGTGKLSRMAEAIALEIVNSLDIRGKVGFAGVAGSLDHMPGVKSIWNDISALFAAED